MQPNDTQRPSIDGVRKPVKRQPEMRPDHELPAPEPEVLIEANEPAPKDGRPRKLLLAINKKKGWRKWLLIVVGLILIVALSVAAWAYAWYQNELAPVSTDKAKHVRVIIHPGASPSAIADELKSAGVIRSVLAFGIYTKLTGTENNLKAGSYDLQPSLSTPKIVDHLVEGKQDTFNVTFLPGGTVADARKTLLDLGYSEAEVDTALNKTYDSPLFATKPAGTDLEGYLYGETIQFDASATVEAILERFFDEYEAVITENNLVTAFKKQGLSLYEGITLSSIVQRETSNPDSQKQVARVFLNRLKIDMALGSDVTYQYAAKKMGVAPTPTLDSPYNTRIHGGLPPGPIATPGKSALVAVANPGNNDYLFFLAGDDNLMHYAKTDEQHQQNIARYCQQKCSVF